MTKTLIAEESTTINAPIATVWDALVNPARIKEYMFGTSVTSDWNEGDTIVFRGEWEGKTYEDKGRILKVEDERMLQYTHFSNLSGLPDVPENYHTVTFELSAEGDQKTRITVCQDNNKSEDAQKHSKKMWAGVLVSLKNLLEK